MLLWHNRDCSYGLIIEYRVFGDPASDASLSLEKRENFLSGISSHLQNGCAELIMLNSDCSE